MPFATLPNSAHYWLRNGRIPRVLMADSSLGEHLAAIAAPPLWEDLVAVDIEIQQGQILRILPPEPGPSAAVSGVDLAGGLVWPCFADLHTHLDKGHMWPRMPNPDGTFDQALSSVLADYEKKWPPEDLYRRMNFGLRCSYAHGTQAIRTHLDAFGPSQGADSMAVFNALAREWAGRLTLQAVCLVGTEVYLTPEGEALADVMAESGGLLGAVTEMGPDLDKQLDRLFELAMERGLNLDLHVDESLDPTDTALGRVAQAKLRHGFTGSVVCGHCCSLSVQSPEVVTETINLVKQAEIGIVSLPMCNLYLQDRQAGRMPRFRGVTLLHELQAAGVPVALASDNCRDPFYAYGDHDGLEVFTQAARMGHLDRPYGAWPQAVSRTPAQLMGLDLGLVAENQPADLVVFKARTFNELMSRPQADRVVIRNGLAIDTTLPDYAELDDLVSFTP